MTLDDDSILSAYLDGELGPDQQQAVESAFVADPQLSEELRSLTLLRDLVAGLPREASPDVKFRVMRRVRRRALLGTAMGSIAWGPIRAAVLVAIAAGVLMMLALPWLLHVGREPGIGRGPTVAELDGSREPKARPIVSERLWPPFSTHVPREGIREPLRPGDHRPPQPDPTDGRESVPGELVYVREYLDNPNLRRIFMISDVEDGSAQQHVASVVEQTTRFNFYKITVSQGIVIDPRHPDRATVFALVVGPQELESLRQRLRTALNDRVEEAPVEPGIVTQLADIGHVEACPPSPTAEMAIPRDALALRTDAPVVGEAVEAPPADRSKAIAPPTPEQERSSPNAEVEARAYVVLVWVSRGRPG
jgi:hypothetical protein